MKRELLAAAANEASRLSRIAGPALSADSTRETLLAWLVWADPNGSYEDAETRPEAGDPMTIDEMWGAVEEALS